MRDETPSWEVLQALIRSSGLLSAAEKTAALWAVDRLRTLLGPSWVEERYERAGQLPDELIYAASHSYVFPMLLATVARLDAVADVEPSFESVLTSLRRDLHWSTWLHVRLQLEVARALKGQGMKAVFEPAISGSNSSADIQVFSPDGSTCLVEVSSLARAQADLDDEADEERFREELQGIEFRHNVYCIARLDGRVDGAETAEWIAAIDTAASETASDRRPRSVTRRAGRVEIRNEAPLGRTTNFRGALHLRDGWRRLRRELYKKAKQSAGPIPVWLRIDVLDGFFQLTDWSRWTWTERIDRLAAATHDVLKGAHHVHGVVFSSGLAASFGSVDPDKEDFTEKTRQGTGIRRMIVPHLARETVIIPLHSAGEDLAESWINAYVTEPRWFAEDVARAGTLAETWSQDP